jgi:tetratricopeptide (TPR) repeat protein
MMKLKTLPPILLLITLGACSTAPRRPAEVYTIRGAAVAQLELVNREIDRGNYEQALEYIGEARRLAVNTDDPLLRVRSALSMGNILFFLGMTADAQEAWQGALYEATIADNDELTAICRIYIARGRLLQIIWTRENAAAQTGAGAAPGAAASDPTAGPVGDPAAEAPLPGAATGIAPGAVGIDEVIGSPTGNSSRGMEAAMEFGDIRARITEELRHVRKDQLATALGYTVIGLAEKELRRFKEAETAFRRSLTIHTAENYLEQAAEDWYLIASVRSVSGNYAGALAALDEALILDRRAENSYGLGKDWMAMGEVYTRMGRGTEADAAYIRASQIFNSIGFTEDAREAGRRRADS